MSLEMRLAELAAESECVVESTVPSAFGKREKWMTWLNAEKSICAEAWRLAPIGIITRAPQARAQEQRKAKENGDT